MALPSDPVVAKQPSPTLKLGQAISLSSSQERFADLSEKGPDAHLSAIISLVIRLRGDIDLKDLSETFIQLQERQEVLRLRVDVKKRTQTIADSDFAQLEYSDYRDVPSEDRWTSVREKIEQEAQEVFQLGEEGLLRAQGYIISEREIVVLLSVHHMACDGFGIFLLLDDWSNLYSNRKGQDRPLFETQSYTDFLEHNDAWIDKNVKPLVQSQLLPLYKEPLQKLDLTRMLKYSQALGAPHALASEGSDYIGQRIGDELGPNPLKALKKLSQSQGATLFMTLLAAWQALVSHAHGYQDFSLVVPMAARGYPGIDKAVANCVNLIPIQFHTKAEMKFAQLLAEIKGFMGSLYGVMDYPNRAFVKDLRAIGKIGDEIPWNNTFNLEPAQKMAKFESVPVQLVSFPARSVEFPLMVNITEVSGFLRIDLDIQLKSFSAEAALLLVNQYKVLLDRLGSTNGQISLERLCSDLPNWNNMGDAKWRKKQIIASDS